VVVGWVAECKFLDYYLLGREGDVVLLVSDGSSGFDSLIVAACSCVISVCGLFFIALF
jgi:hypothetical protein